MAEAAQAAGSLEAVHGDAETFAAYCAANRSIVGVLSNPVLTDAKKKDLIAKMAKEGSFSPLFVSFLNLLVDKRRISLVDEILADFEEIYCGLTDTQARGPASGRESTGAGRLARGPAPALHYPRHPCARRGPDTPLRPRSPVALAWNRAPRREGAPRPARG